MPFHGVEHGADKLVGIDQGKQFVGFGGTDDLGIHAEITAFRMNALQPLESLGRRRQHDPAGHVQTDVLAGCFLDLAVQVNSVLLKLGDVGIAVDSMHAAGGMPGRSRGKLRSFQKHDIGPAEFCQMVQDRTSNDATADDDNPRCCFQLLFPFLAGKTQSSSLSDLAEIGCVDGTAV